MQDRASLSKKILTPLPSVDFDPTEAAVPWKILKDHGFTVVFSTPAGQVATADQKMVSGKGLGIWARLLKADAKGLSAYNEMRVSPEFLHPLPWSEIRCGDFAGIVLPGGHAPGMKEYLESSFLQKTIADFFEEQKLVGAICHGVVLAARSQSPRGQSVLWGRQTTALLKSQELSAWALTGLWMRNYYRTYPETVQSEVTRHLAQKNDFFNGPWPLQRDSLAHLRRGFVLQDGNYISARWPGDAHAFGLKLAQFLLKGS